MLIENETEREKDNENAVSPGKTSRQSSERTHHYGQKDDEESRTVYFTSPRAQKEAGKYTQT